MEKMGRKTDFQAAHVLSSVGVEVVSVSLKGPHEAKALFRRKALVKGPDLLWGAGLAADIAIEQGALFCRQFGAAEDTWKICFAKPLMDLALPFKAQDAASLHPFTFIHRALGDDNRSPGTAGHSGNGGCCEQKDTNDTQLLSPGVACTSSHLLSPNSLP
jgi:hypothetical protein